MTPFLLIKTFKELTLNVKDFCLVGFTDADWASSMEQRRSVSGYVFCLSYLGGAISVKSRRQRLTALSSAEAEYYAMSKEAASGLGLQSMLRDWRIEAKIELYCDFLRHFRETPYF